jgi:hypothetical protein
MSSSEELDKRMREAAFQHVRMFSATRDHLTSNDLAEGFVFDGKRIPLVNPQRGIFKPREMRYLLSIRTVFPRPGAAQLTNRSRGARSRVARVDPTRNGTALPEMREHEATTHQPPYPRTILGLHVLPGLSRHPPASRKCALIGLFCHPLPDLRKGSSEQFALDRHSRESGNPVSLISAA